MSKKVPTVKFNVGGTNHEVSRTLLDRYPNSMLTRMVSWEDDRSNENALFIERDGGIFKFVLQYMRDGKANVPTGCGVSKESVLFDLEYYGFEDVPADAIQTTPGGIWDCHDTIAALNLRHQCNEICVKLAHDCYQLFLANRKTTTLYIRSNGQAYKDVALLYSQPWNEMQKLNECLAMFELKCTSFDCYGGSHQTHYEIRLEKLTP